VVKRKIEWFEGKATLECVICNKDIEVGDHYCLNDTGEPMHYYCYNASILVKEEETEKQTDSEESEEEKQCKKR
jgi:hypothetical protein